MIKEVTKKPTGSPGPKEFKPTPGGPMKPDTGGGPVDDRWKR